MTEIILISSRQNEHIAAVAQLKKEPSAEACFLEGSRFVTDADASDIRELFVTDVTRYAEKADAVRRAGGTVYEVTPPVMEKLCSGTTDIAAVVRYSPLPMPDRLVLLDAVQDPGNVGTVIRTAAAFGFGVILGEGCANPFGAKAIQSTAGALPHCPIRRLPLVREIPRLKSEGFTVFSAELDEKALRHTALPKSGKRAVIIGNEGNGVSEEVSVLADEKVYIPISGVNSLNAAVAAAILMDRTSDDS